MHEHHHHDLHLDDDHINDDHHHVHCVCAVSRWLYAHLLGRFLATDFQLSERRLPLQWLHSNRSAVLGHRSDRICLQLRQFQRRSVHDDDYDFHNDNARSVRYVPVHLQWHELDSQQQQLHGRLRMSEPGSFVRALRLTNDNQLHIGVFSDERVFRLRGA